MDAAFHIRPFAFDRVFETAVPLRTAHAEPEDLQLMIATLEAELALARADCDHHVAVARADGFDAGLAQAQSDRDTALLAAVDALHATIETVEAELESVAQEATREAASVAIVAAEMLAGRALVEYPGGAIDAAIGRALQQVARGQEIAVAVAPDLVPEIERLVAIRQNGDRRRLALTVHADAALAIGDAHIHWERGGVVLDATSRVAAVEAALGPVLSPTLVG